MQTESYGFDKDVIVIIQKGSELQSDDTQIIVANFSQRFYIPVEYQVYINFVPRVASIQSPSGKFMIKAWHQDGVVSGPNSFLI